MNVAATGALASRLERQPGLVPWVSAHARVCVPTGVCVCARAWVPVPFFELPPKTFLLKMVIFKPGCAEVPGALYTPPMTGAHRKQLEGGHPGCGVQTSAQFPARRSPLCSRELSGPRTWTWKEPRGPAQTAALVAGKPGRAAAFRRLRDASRGAQGFKELIVFQKLGQGRQSGDSGSGNRSWSFVRGIYIYKGNLHLRGGARVCTSSREEVDSQSLETLSHRSPRGSPSA